MDHFPVHVSTMQANIATVLKYTQVGNIRVAIMWLILSIVFTVFLAVNTVKEVLVTYYFCNKP